MLNEESKAFPISRLRKPQYSCYRADLAPVHPVVCVGISCSDRSTSLWESIQRGSGNNPARNRSRLPARTGESEGHMGLEEPF